LWQSAAYLMFCPRSSNVSVQPLLYEYRKRHWKLFSPSYEGSANSHSQFARKSKFPPRNSRDVRPDQPPRHPNFRFSHHPEERGFASLAQKIYCMTGYVLMLLYMNMIPNGSQLHLWLHCMSWPWSWADTVGRLSITKPACLQPMATKGSYSYSCSLHLYCCFTLSV